METMVVCNMCGGRHWDPDLEACPFCKHPLDLADVSPDTPERIDWRNINSLKDLVEA